MDMAGMSFEGMMELGMAKLILAFGSVPLWEYAVLGAVLLVIAVYNYVDLHLVSHLLTGDAAKLVYSSESNLAKEVLQKMTFDRFWPTPWLCSAHLQTLFLHFCSIRPRVEYRRELLKVSDGGTVGIDWADPLPDGSSHIAPETDNTPIVLIVPGLTSDSRSQYVMHAVAAILKKGWRGVVANHRGLGGVPLTSQKFYTAGWTQDLQHVLRHIGNTFPAAPVAALGTSLGANILVKYLGEEGKNAPVFAAAAIGCPWDLMVVDRWMQRSSKQRLYGIGLIYGLKELAHMHKDSFAKMFDWDRLSKAKSVREFDDYATRILGKFETVDTYYRHCSSAQFLPGVAVPLLGISALDDPICTREAIPTDECRANSNVILGITAHGGHLAYLEGFTANRIWWARHVVKFFDVVLNSPSLQGKQGRLGAVNPSAGTSPLLILSSSEADAALPGPETELPFKPSLRAVFEPIEEGAVRSDEDGRGDGTLLEQKGGSAEASAVEKTVVVKPFPLCQEGEKQEVGEKQVLKEEVRPSSDVKEEGATSLRSVVRPVGEGSSGEGGGEEEHELVLRVRGREELELLESVLMNLLKVVRMKSQGPAFPLPSSELGGGADTAAMSASSIAASASAIAAAAASVVESASLVMSMMQSAAIKPETLREEVAWHPHGYSAELSGGPVEVQEGSRNVRDGGSGRHRESGGDKGATLTDILAKGLSHLEVQNRRSMWLMVYVSLTTTCPLVLTVLALRLYLRNRGGVHGSSILASLLN